MVLNSANQPYYDQLSKEISQLEYRKYKISLCHLLGVLFIIGLQVLEAIFIMIPKDEYVLFWPLLLIAYNLLCIMRLRSTHHDLLEKRLKQINVRLARYPVTSVKS